MASQAGSYAALLVGGVLAAAGFSGNTVRDVLAGKGSSLKPLFSAPAGAGSGPVGATGSTAATGSALSGSGYVFPLGHGWQQGRVDQGVDFAPAHSGAPILAPGNARVVKVGAPGWPSGGKGVLLQLLDGSLKGMHVFIYEAIKPLVRSGQIVHRGQQIGSGVFGETGIEMGFADANGVPLSHSEYTEGKETVWGKKMREWLRGLTGR